MAQRTGHKRAAHRDTLTPSQAPCVPNMTHCYPSLTMSTSGAETTTLLTARSPPLKLLSAWRPARMEPEQARHTDHKQAASRPSHAFPSGMRAWHDPLQVLPDPRHERGRNYNLTNLWLLLQVASSSHSSTGSQLQILDGRTLADCFAPFLLGDLVALTLLQPLTSCFRLTVEFCQLCQRLSSQRFATLPLRRLQCHVHGSACRALFRWSVRFLMRMTAWLLG